MISMILFLLSSLPLFIFLSAASVSIHFMPFFLLLFFRRFYLFPRIPFFCFFCICAKNYGFSVVSPYFLTLLYCPVSNTTLNLTLNSCFNAWLILPNLSASSLILLLRRCSPLIRRASNCMFPKTRKIYYDSNLLCRILIHHIKCFIMWIYISTNHFC